MAKKAASLVLLVVMLVSVIPSTVLAANKGWVKKGNDWYYYESDGSMAMGWKKIGKTWYFFDDDYGNMYSDAWHWETNSKGIDVAYYFAESGAMQSNKWKLYYVSDKENWMYLTSDGSSAVGWKKIGKDWYYFDEEDYVENQHYACMVSESIIDGRYYVDKSGKMVKNKWIMWYEDPGYYRDWLYFDKNGMVVQNCWKQIDKKWYYFSFDGFAYTGLRYLDYNGKEEAFYFDEMNANMLTGWIYKYSNWYYGKSSGVLYRDCSVKIGGKTYTFDSYGRCLNP